MAVRTILVCEAQVPLVRGGAESHVRQLVDRLRERGYHGRSRVGAVQVVSEGGDPRARRRVAPARSQREQRHADRPGDRDEVPVVLRPAPEQGDVAHPPVPRGLRAVRHRLQRLRPRGSRRRPARSSSSSSTREMLGECRRLFTNAAQHRGPPREVQRAAGRTAVSSAEAGRSARRRPGRGLHPVGRPARDGQAPRSRHRARWRRPRGPRGSSSSARARRTRTCARLAEELGVGDRVRVRRRGRRRARCSSCTPARSASSTRRSTRTTAT